MNDTIKWYESKGVIGSLVVVGAGLAGMVGYTISPEDQTTLVELVISVITTVFGALAWFGRVKATKRVE